MSTVINEADRLRREVLAYVIRALLAGQPEELDRIPIRMRPKGGPSSRCCIYKDRAALRYRCMSALGRRVEDEADESTRLADYARRLPQAPPAKDPFITLFPDACSACLESQTIVTDLCRGCLARPCTTVCPRQAVTIRNGRAAIDHPRCVNCGKCTGVCRYHAIINLPLACADACPVKAVKKSDDGRVLIDHTLCIRCGQCVKACPFAAIMQTNQVSHVVTAIRQGRPAVALVAPAASAAFPESPRHLYTALRRLGFSAVCEVAAGADETARLEALEWVGRRASGAPFMTTSCCPAWLECVKRHIPEIAPHVSHTPSPMILTARRAREQWPGALTVFIGPCMAKRTEAAPENGPVDHVLTIEELGAWLMATHTQLADLDPGDPDLAGTPAGHGFALGGGVARAVVQAMPPGEPPPTLHRIDGLTPKNIALLKVFARNSRAPAQLIEVMGCPGGCAAGPCNLEAPAAIAARLPPSTQ